jgi:hypothetical protein
MVDIILSALGTLVVGRSFTISSIKLWNSLPPEIKRKQSIGSFKNALRKHFVGTYANIDYFSVNM